MMSQGETPEGNVSTPKQYPHISWLGCVELERHTANFSGGVQIAETAAIDRLPESKTHWYYRMCSQTNANLYTIKVCKKTAEEGNNESVKFGDLVVCNCPGHRISLGKVIPTRADRICKHCCGVLARCIRDRDGDNLVQVGPTVANVNALHNCIKKGQKMFGCRIPALENDRRRSCSAKERGKYSSSVRFAPDNSASSQSKESRRVPTTDAPVLRILLLPSPFVGLSGGRPQILKQNCQEQIFSPTTALKEKNSVRRFRGQTLGESCPS